MLSLTVRCNICSIGIEEKEVESHISSQQHMNNKLKISINEKGSDKSVAKLWYDSLD